MLQLARTRLSKSVLSIVRANDSRHDGDSFNFLVVIFHFSHTKTNHRSQPLASATTFPIASRANIV